MGYTHGTQWNDALIERRIFECISGLGIVRMPSRSEMREFYGDDALTNKVNKTLGYYGWAQRLGLPMKDSDTQTGKVGEALAKMWLETKGYHASAMPQNHPYDLLVDEKTRVDVKYSNLYTTKRGFNFYSFRLDKREPTCDIYILITHSKDGVFSYYVVPAKDVRQTQVSIGEKQSKYHKYLNRLDLLKDVAA